MPKCNKLIHLYGAYVYGDTAPEETARIEEHLSECAGCREDIEIRKKVILAIPNALPKMSSDDRQYVSSAVRAQVRMNREKRMWWQAASPFIHTLSLATTLVIVFAGGTMFGLHLQGKINRTYLPPPESGQTQASQSQSEQSQQPAQTDRQNNPPVFYQPPPASSADPFDRSLGGYSTSRWGWDWRLGWPDGSWQIPAPVEEPQQKPEQDKQPDEEQKDKAEEGSGQVDENTQQPLTNDTQESDTGNEERETSSKVSSSL